MNKMNLITFFALQIKKHEKFIEMLKRVARIVSPETIAVLDYPLNIKQRWDPNHPHKKLYDIINQNRESYKSTLQSFLTFSNYFADIPTRSIDDPALSQPSWINGYMPALDSIALYGFIATYKPNIYMEVGSGNSTKFARKAITDHNLKTKIISIDPHPRAEIDAICDEVIRKPVEETAMQIFDRLHTNDVLYIDNSHRVFMNSDVTTVFLDVIPRLSPGVFIQIHDVFLPYDYPVELMHRYYSEHYLLAAFLLGQGNMFDTILPNTFISNDNELKNIVSPLWQIDTLKPAEKHGCSFWMRMK